jgi:hypothetical protein
MADENRELIEAMEELRRSFGGMAMTVEELDEAQKKAGVGMKAFQKTLGKVPGQVAAGMGSFAKSVAEGDTSLKSLNTVVDTASGALAAMAKTIPFAGDAVAAGIKAVGEASKFVINQLDATAKVFNDFGKVGALGTKGMTGVFEQFNRSGMSLQSFNKAVADNAQTLARFRGMTAEGAEGFSKIVGGIVDSDAGMELRRIGLSADQMGESAGAFVAQQTRLGRSQAMTQQQLTSGTVQYVKELDQLSKVTGLSREAIQKQQDAALSESKFRANYELAMQSGDAARIRGAEAMMTLQTRMQSFGADLGQGVRDLSAGIANTDAARKMVASTGGAALDIMNRLKAGAIDQDQAQQELADAMSRHKNTQLQIASQVGDTVGVFSDTAQTMDFINGAQKGQWTKAKAVQDAQTKGGDKLTDATVSAQENLEQMNRKMAQLGFQLMPDAAVAIKAFTNSLNDFLGWMGEKLGIDMPGTKKTGAAAARAEHTAKTQGTAEEQMAAATGSAGTAQLTPQESAAYAAKQGAAKSYAGLKLKSPEAVAGGESSGALIELAYNIQDALGSDLKYFSGLNDTRKSKDGKSKHGTGQAIDIVLNDPEKYASALATIKGMKGVSFAQFEEAGQVNANGTVSSGAHIHAEVSAANGFSGMISGPSSGYKPNLTMHGTEQISIQPNPNTGSVSPNSDSNIMSQQLAKLEELVSVMKTQVSISSKLLSYSS